MASTVATEKLTANLAVTHYDFDPNVDTAVDVAWVDMHNFGHFLCSFFRTVGTGDVDGFKILANSASDGSGTDVEIKVHALGSQPNAVGDYVFLECTAAEIAALGSNLRYVSASLELATSTDEAVVTYIRGCPRNAHADLSVDTVA